MKANSPRQHVNELTRRNNILDIMMTPDLSISVLEVTEEVGDHQMIDFTLEVHKPNIRTRQKQLLDYKRAKFELMKEELGQILMRNKNAEECNMILKEKIATATEHHTVNPR
ncbi:hypothetical protein FHG87_025276 [Trinorchestia longiramus]|nr:hypothetical protein FHG87_025276 [Trinorchestia longiramus]